MTVGFDLRRRPLTIDELKNARGRALARYIVACRLEKVRREQEQAEIDETVTKLVKQELGRQPDYEWLETWKPLPERRLM